MGASFWCAVSGLQFAVQMVLNLQSIPQNKLQTANYKPQTLKEEPSTRSPKQPNSRYLRRPTG